MTGRIKKALERLLVTKLNELAIELENIDIEESSYYSALADEIACGKASEDTILEAIERVEEA